jgi:hypothetical protein
VIAFRYRVFMLYVFLLSVAVVLAAYTYSSLSNPFFGTRFTNAPAWFEVGMQFFLVGFATCGLVASVLCVWGLAQRKRWARGLITVIAWFTLVFYFGSSLLLYLTNAFLAVKSHPVLFFIFDAKTLWLTSFSLATLVVLRSKQFRDEYSLSTNSAR